MTGPADRMQGVAVVVAAALLVGALLRSLLVAGHHSAGEWVVAGVFALAIVASEPLRVDVEGGPSQAPLSTATAFGYATTTSVLGFGPTVGDGPFVAAVIGVAMLVGGVVHHAFGGRTNLHDVAVRYLCVAVTAYAFRGFPLLPHSGRLLRWVEDPTHPRWVAAALILLVTIIGIAAGALIQGAATAHREHLSVRRVLADEVVAGGGLSAAMGSTGTVIALAEPAMGLLALPLVLFLIALTYFAVRRRSLVIATRRETTLALSQLPEIAGFSVPGHAAQVTALAVALGRELGMSERSITPIEYAAMLHDVGQVTLREPIPFGATSLAAPPDQEGIAEASADIVSRGGGGLAAVAEIVRSQALPFHLVRSQERDIPRPARIVKVANGFVDFLAEESSTPEAALERVFLGLGYEYDPEVADALARLVERGAPATRP